MEIFIICLVVFSLIFPSGIIIYLVYQHNQQRDKINSLQEELKKKQELDISEKQRLQCSILDLETELDDLGNEYAALANQKKQAETEVKKPQTINAQQRTPRTFIWRLLIMNMLKKNLILINIF